MSPQLESSGHECDVKIDTWLKDMLAQTPGAVRKVVRREFILAAREFFEQTSAWRVVVGPKNMVANKKRYYMSPYDAYSDIVQVLSVELDGCPLRPLARRPAGVEPDATRPWGYFLESPDAVRLWPMPTESKTNALTFYVALTPKQTVKALPAKARTHWYDALLDGALGRLMAHPAKPYSDPARGTYHLNRFRAAIGKYAGEAKQTSGHAGAWSFPRFGK